MQAPTSNTTDQLKEQYITQLSQLQKQLEAKITDLNTMVQLLENNIRTAERGNVDTIDVSGYNDDLSPLIQQFNAIYAKINQPPTPNKQSFLIKFLKVTLFYVKKMIESYNSIVKKIKKNIELVKSIDENISSFNLSNLVGYELRKDKLILMLLQALNLLNKDIQTYVQETSSYKSNKSSIQTDLQGFLDLILHNATTESNKLKQLNNYYEVKLNIAQNENNNEANDDINNLLLAVRNQYQEMLLLFTDGIMDTSILVPNSQAVIDTMNASRLSAIVQPTSLMVGPLNHSGVLLDISDAVFQFDLNPDATAKPQATTQTDAITVLNYYLSALEELKKKPKTDDNIKKSKEIQLRIKKNVELLAETMVYKKIDLAQVPAQIRSELDKKYKELMKQLEKETKKQQGLIKALINKKQDDKSITELANSISNEILLSKLNSLDIMSISQFINQKLMPALSYNVVKEVKIRTIEQLKDKLKSHTEKMLTQDIADAQKDVSDIQQAYALAQQMNPIDQQRMDQLASELTISLSIVDQMEKRKTQIMDNMDDYIDAWVKKQNEKVKSLGFNETIEKIPEPNYEKVSIKTTCGAIENTKKELLSPHYFPSQFPNLVKM